MLVSILFGFENENSRLEGGNAEEEGASSSRALLRRLGLPRLVVPWLWESMFSRSGELEIVRNFNQIRRCQLPHVILAVFAVGVARMKRS